MSMPIAAKRIAREELGLDERAGEGRLDEALGAVLRARRDELHPRHVEAVLAGTTARKLTAYMQLLARDAGIDAGGVDGLWGPQTSFAFESLQHRREHGALPRPWRDLQPGTANPNGWPSEREGDLVSFYGRPGDESRLVAVDLPYPHRLSWDLNSTIRRTRCHEKVADSYVRVLERVRDEFGLESIRRLRLDRWGGCYNCRKKRGGTSWSTHAWGIAHDYDPERNRLQWGRDRAAFARPEYDRWWEIWEEEGWYSLGRHKNFDWMHVQATRA